jgi:hypothetical protein
VRWRLAEMVAVDGRSTLGYYCPPSSASIGPRRRVDLANAGRRGGRESVPGHAHCPPAADLRWHAPSCQLLDLLHHPRPRTPLPLAATCQQSRAFPIPPSRHPPPASPTLSRSPLSFSQHGCSRVRRDRVSLRVGCASASACQWRISQWHFLSPFHRTRAPVSERASLLSLARV